MSSGLSITQLEEGKRVQCTIHYGAAIGRVSRNVLLRVWRPNYHLMPVYQRRSLVLDVDGYVAVNLVLVDGAVVT